MSGGAPDPSGGVPDASADAPDSPGGVPAGPVVTGWMRRVPWILALLALATTTAALTLTPVPVPRVLGWGLTALVCAGAVAMATRVVLARPVFGGALAPAAEHAARANAVGGVTAIGLLAVVACLAGQAVAVHNAIDSWQPIPGAVEQAALVCAVAAVLVAGLLVGTMRPLPDVDGGVRPPGAAATRLIVGIAVVAVLGSAVWIAAAWLNTRPPYQAAAVRPVATVRFTDHDHFSGDAAAIGATGLAGLAGTGQREFVGRLDMTVPAAAKDSGTYVLVVIDARANRIASWIDGPDVPGAGTGWAGAWEVVPERYPWLSAMRSVYLSDGHSDPVAYMMNPDAGRTVAFEGLLDSDSAARSPGDLTAALIYFGPDGQLYWATQVPVTTA